MTQPFTQWTDRTLSQVNIRTSPRDRFERKVTCFQCDQQGEGTRFTYPEIRSMSEIMRWFSTTQMTRERAQFFSRWSNSSIGSTVMCQWRRKNDTWTYFLFCFLVRKKNPWVITFSLSRSFCSSADKPSHSARTWHFQESLSNGPLTDKENARGSALKKNDK